MDRGTDGDTLRATWDGDFRPTPARQAEREWHDMRVHPGIGGVVRRVGREVHESLVRMQLGRRLDRLRFIVILGHVRSGSSMLLQVLASHPQIDGFGETHRPIRGGRSMIDMAVTVYRRLRRWRLSPSPIVLEKVLHNELMPEVGGLLSFPIHWVLVVRNPTDAVSSTCKTFGADRERARQYYRERLPRLVEQVRQIESATPGRVYLTTYETTTQRTEHELAALGQWLGLNEPLRSSYEVQRAGQGGGAGDPSENLRLGKVQPRTHAQHDQSDDLWALYKEALATLRSICASSETVDREDAKKRSTASS